MTRHKPALIILYLGILVLSAFPSRQSALPESKVRWFDNEYKDIIQKTYKLENQLVKKK